MVCIVLKALIPAEGSGSGAQSCLGKLLPIENIPVFNQPCISSCLEVTAKHTSGYICHPAILDATLHLAAGIQGQEQAVLRVPASVGFIVSKALQVGTAHSSACQMDSTSESVTCGFKLAAGTASAVQIGGMVAKEMHVPDARAEDEQVADFLYETEMQASRLPIVSNNVAQPSLVSLDRRARKRAKVAYGRAVKASEALPALPKGSLAAVAPSTLGPLIAATRSIHLAKF